MKASKKKREKQEAVQELRDTFDEIRDEVRGMETGPPPMPGEPGYDDGTTLDFGATDQAYAAGIGEVPSDYGSDYSVGAGEIDVASIVRILAEHNPEINLNIEVHSQFAPFTLNILKEDFFETHASPP